MESEPPLKAGPNIPVIPDYELLRVIGRGAYGEIWLAHGLTRAWRAVKVVYRKTFESERAFNREFSGMSAFEPISRAHDGFVDILHVGRNDVAGFFYYVMELADDEVTGAKIDLTNYTPRTLKSADGVALPANECIRLGTLLTEALGALHDHGLTHRDIKPSNIIFVNGVPKLADIGLVATSGQQSFVGTEGYVPPEGPGTAQADLYSLGKVLYEISMGKDRLDFPEVGSNLEARSDKPQLLALNTVLLKACAPTAAKRYRDAEEMRRDLVRIDAGEPIARSGVRWRLIALALLAFGIAIPVLLKMRSSQRRGPDTPTQSIVTIESEPAGAMILLGDRMKRSPARFEALEPGKYPLRVMLPDYDPIETRIELTGEQPVSLPPFKLQRSKGSAQFTSQPDGVDFELSRAGEPPRRATTPSTMRDLATGIYDVVARRGEWEVRDRMEIKRGEMAMKAFEFGTAKTTVLSEPPGAEIFVDGKSRGLSPLEIELPAGAHRFRARYAEWPEAEQSVTVEKEREGRVLFEFGNGSVKIISAPGGAIVFQDGRELGVTPLLVEEVKPGEVSYELRKSGFKPAVVRGAVQSKQQAFLDARLEKVPGGGGDGPWENSLGMRFVPVGNVRICVWETRVKDWVAFCRATGRVFEKPDFSQSENDPAVKVNWRDATDFCEWLTQEERRQNRIDEMQSYRLPSDQEWSTAAGIPEESGATPEERDGKLKGIHPWGKQWPPVSASGNYADQAARGRGPIIEGYADGFAATAPSGSFKANGAGLHDLGGNVWEWCSDFYKPGSRWGVLRGGSWANSNRTELLTSYRNVVDRTERDVIYGFRCVLTSGDVP